MDIVSAKEIPAIKTLVARLSQDQRGVFAETWREDLMHEAGLASHFVQDNHVITHDAGTIRGLHFQTGAAAQAKVVRCIRGSVLDVAADIRNGSPTYGKYVAVLLTSNNWTQLYIPVGFAHGYCTVEPNSEVLYKVSTAYDPAAERGIVWNDPDLCIKWPISDFQVKLSKKDRSLPALADLPPYFEFTGGSA